MAAREALYRLVDALPEQDLPVAARILEALQRTPHEMAPLSTTGAPADKSRKVARILSPRLARAEQASDFKKEVLEPSPDADI